MMATMIPNERPTKEDFDFERIYFFVLLIDEFADHSKQSFLPFFPFLPPYG